MRKHLLLSFIFLIVTVIAGFFVLFDEDFFLVQKTEAGSGHNVYGWAWSETVGWISFNNTSGGGGVDYGVNIEADGNLTGYAWSEHIGWIHFDPPGPYPNSPNYSARVDLTNQQLSGWVRALSYGSGWDGWIKMRRDAADSGADYGVWIDTGIAPHQFRGWAWGSDVVGWVSFNHSNCDPDEDGFSNGSGVCPAAGTPIADYMVQTSFSFNQPPTVSEMIDPDTTENYCNIASGLGQVGFEWKYNDEDGDNETRFDIRVNDVNNVEAGGREVDQTRNSPACSDLDPGTAISCINTAGATVGIDLNYNTTYYWWVRVYDDQGNDSGWVAGPSFRTASHAWPWPDFTHAPQNPTEGEEVTFDDISTCYDAANNPYTCESGAPTYFWDFGDGKSSSMKGDTVNTYETAGSYTVTLSITDPTVGTCQGTGDSPVEVTISLPEWEEITPY